MSCARGVAGAAGAVIGVMGSGVASRAVLGMSSLHIVSAKPSLLTDARIRAAYSEGAGIYRILPQAAAGPASVAELAALLRWASDTRPPLVPRGAGSGMTGGNVGRGVIVDVSRCFRELTVDPARRLARAGASVTWAEVNAAARDFGLRLPPDPSSGAFATSGGMASTNAAGPRSLRYGSVRRWIEAVEIVDVRGEIRRVARGAGWGMRDAIALAADERRLIEARFPKTRKNSSGYALDAFAESGDELDLLIGSEGTLAFITQIEWRLEPILPDVAGVALGFGALEALGDAVPYLLALNPSAVELLDRTILSFVEEAGVSLPLGLACLLLVEFERETAAAAGDGHVHVNTLPDVSRAGWEDGVRALYEAVAGLQMRLGGTPSGEHGDGRLRAGLLERVYGPEVVAEFRRVKRAYDPLEILNPGDILPAADWQPLVDLKVGAAATPIPDDIAARLRELERTASWATPKTSLAGT